MMLARAKKGFIAVFWLSLFIIVLVAFNTTVLYNLVSQQIAMTKHREVLSQNYLYADIGTCRGIWLMKDGGTVPTSGSPYMEFLYIDPDTKAVSLIDDASNDIRVLIANVLYQEAPAGYKVYSSTTGMYENATGGSYRAISATSVLDASMVCSEFTYKATIGYSVP